MLKILCAVAMATLFSVSPVFALSDAEYTQMYRASPYFRAADDALTQTWKETTRQLSPKDKKYLLQEQRQWLRSERDEEAQSLMRQGIRKDCAYAQAIRSRIASLRAFAYNSALSQEDKDAGRIKADSFFEDETELPAECRK